MFSHHRSRAIKNSRGFKLPLSDQKSALGWGPLTKHDVVFGVSVHVCLVQTSWKQLHIAAPTVDVLLVFHRKLHHQRLTLVAEGLESRRQSIEPGILASLQAYRDTIVRSGFSTNPPGNPKDVKYRPVPASSTCPTPRDTQTVLLNLSTHS